MKKHNEIEKWIPDKSTYSEIQKLKKFVEFVSNLKFSTNKDKQKTKEIEFLIENINNPETHKEWCVCLDIFDRKIQNGQTKEGLYWRKWAVFFESNSLEIIAESKHTAENLGHYGEQFYFYGSIYFEKAFTGKRIYLDEDIDDFTNDSETYEKYITAQLNDIEVDIDIW